MRVFIAFFFSTFIFFSCQNDDSSLQQQERNNLITMYLEIEKLSQSAPCTDETKWSFVAFEAKACGGPQGYLAYSSEIDTVLFLQKVEAYTNAEKEFNSKWNVISDCSLPSTPKKVVFLNNLPNFIY